MYIFFSFTILEWKSQCEPFQTNVSWKGIEESTFAAFLFADILGILIFVIFHCNVLSIR